MRVGGWLIAGLASMLLAGAMPSDHAVAGDFDAWGDGRFGASVGAMAIVMPKYEGSSDYRVIGFPFIVPSFGTGESWVDVQGADDVRLRLFRYGNFEAGPLAGWRFGREQEDGPLLAGLGDVDAGLVIGGYMAYRLGHLKPFLSYHHQVTGDATSGVLRFGSEASFDVAPGVQITGTVGTSYADENYMQDFFAITPDQSLTSVAGLAAYDAEAGFKDVFVGGTAKIALSELWTLHLTARYARLIGDAADSPIVESENQWTAGIGVAYRFDLR
jgi:outer membrane scaffolding protein for murein synthesis (MipA/OmpV family)